MVCDFSCLRLFVFVFVTCLLCVCSRLMRVCLCYCVCVCVFVYLCCARVVFCVVLVGCVLRLCAFQGVFVFFVLNCACMCLFCD